MNNVLYEMIFKRKSFHTFRNVGDESIRKDELNDIQSAYSEFTPLNPGIKTAIRIVPEKQTNCKRGGEYCVLLYSEKKDGYLQNIGYLGEQLDLYLVSRSIGTLWFGIGKTKEEPFEDMEFVIMFSIRKISDDSKYRKDMVKSKRKSVEEIWEGVQIPGVSDIVRFAPSACNSQPWLVKNNGELSVYRYRKPGKRGGKQCRINQTGTRESCQAEYIGCDLSLSYWKEELINRGFDCSKPSFGSLLGISYYLSKEEWRHLIGTISSFTCEGSSICFDYPLAEGGAESQRIRELAIAAGEPMKAKYSYDEMESFLSEEGFLIYEHMNAAEVTEAFFREYNQKNAEHMMTAPEGVGYCLAVKKLLTH